MTPRDIAERHALVGDRVIPGSRRALLDRQPVETGRIEPVHRGPAIQPVTHIRRNTLLTRDLDEARNEGVIAVAMYLRKPHHRHAHTTRRQRGGRRFRSAGIRGGGGNGRIFLGRDTAPRQQRESGGDEQGPAGAFQRGAERLDSAPVRLAVSANFEKSWLKAVWITPSARPLRCAGSPDLRANHDGPLRLSRRGPPRPRPTGRGRAPDDPRR